jgi:hypothetical protein
MHTCMQLEDVKQLIDSVHRHASVWLDKEVKSSMRLHSLHGRLKPIKDKPPHRIAICFRYFLEVSIPLHRRVLTRLLLVDHPLVSGS